MTTAETLVRPLECEDSERAHWTIPARTAVTVHHLNAARWAVVLDGRVYRARSADVLVAVAS